MTIKLLLSQHRSHHLWFRQIEASDMSLTDTCNNALEDKTLRFEPVTSTHIQPFSLNTSRLVHVLIFHLQVPLSLLRLPHFDWTAENSASGSSFEGLSNRGQTATVTWQRSAVQWSSHLPDSTIGCFSTPATPYFIFADISSSYWNVDECQI